MFKRGEKVRFVNENLEGIVTSVNGNVIGVTIESDFEIPVAAHELVKIELEQAPTVAKTQQVTKKTNFVQVHSGVHIAFERLSETKLQLVLHNSETDLIGFAFYQWQQQSYQLIQTGFVEQETHSVLGSFSLEDFGKWPKMSFQIQYIQQSGTDFKPALVKSIQFSAKEFHASFKQCYFLGKQAYTFRLDEGLKPEDIAKLFQKNTEQPLPPTPTWIPDQKPKQVIDLHIEKLTPNAAALLPAQMVDLQMQVFTNSVEMAFVHRMPKLILIHGVGNHFLKNKIKNWLTRNKEWVQKFNDADPILYGGGATEVWLR